MRVPIRIGAIVASVLAGALAAAAEVATLPGAEPFDAALAKRLVAAMLE